MYNFDSKLEAFQMMVVFVYENVIRIAMCIPVAVNVWTICYIYNILGCIFDEWLKLVMKILDVNLFPLVEFDLKLKIGLQF